MEDSTFELESECFPSNSGAFDSLLLFFLSSMFRVGWVDMMFAGWRNRDPRRVGRIHLLWTCLLAPSVS
jgi:hypothetical protein